MTVESEGKMQRLMTLIMLLLICGMAPVGAFANDHDPKRIMIDELMKKMEAGEDVLFLDTRNSSDWSNAKVMIPNAIRVGSNQLLTEIANETPKGKLIVTYCT